MTVSVKIQASTCRDLTQISQQIIYGNTCRKTTLSGSECTVLPGSEYTIRSALKVLSHQPLKVKHHQPLKILYYHPLETLHYQAVSWWYYWAVLHVQSLCSCSLVELYRALGSSVEAHKAVLAAHPMYANLMERALAKVVLQHVTTLEKFCQVTASSFPAR